MAVACHLQNVLGNSTSVKLSNFINSADVRIGTKWRQENSNPAAMLSCRSVSGANMLRKFATNLGKNLNHTNFETFLDQNKFSANS